MNYKKGILGVFNLIWERRKYHNFYQVLHANNMNEQECDDIYYNLRKTWMRTVLSSIMVITMVWMLYYVQRGIVALSLSVLITIICSGLPILLWFVFDWIENGINKRIRDIRIEKDIPQKNRPYDDFNWLGS